jgi:hypothetical protein
LSFDDHIADLGKKLRPKIGMLSRVHHILPPPQQMTVYMATIQSIIDYGISIWGNCNIGNIQRVQQLQNRCARLLTNIFNRDTRSTMLIRQLGLMTVHERYKYFTGILVYKCLYGSAPHYLLDKLTPAVDLHEHNIRNKFLLQIPPSRTNAMKRSFASRGSALWNKLPKVCHSAVNIHQFKNNLRIAVLEPIL